MSAFNINDHFKPHGDEFLLSLAVTLAVVGDAAQSLDANETGKELALRVINEVLALGRETRFQQIDVLETVLLSPSNGRQRLMVCDSFVKYVGNDAFMAALTRAGFTLQKGGQA